MTIFWAGSSVGDFDEFLALGATTTAAEIGPRVKEGINQPTSGTMGYGRAALAGALTDFWFAFNYVQTGGAARQAEFRFYDSAVSTSQPRMRLFRNAAIWRLEIWNGSTYVVALTDNAADGSPARTRFDVQFVKSDTVGLIRIYRNNALTGEVLNIDTNLTAWTKIDLIEFRPGDNFSVASAMIYADEDTRGIELWQGLVTGNGVHTAWTGGFGDVDEFGYSATDFVTSGTPGDKESFTVTWDAALDATHQVKALLVNPNGRQNVGTAATSLFGLLVIGGTDYESAGKAMSIIASKNFSYSFGTNPATSAAWITADAKAAQIGFRRS